MMMGFISEFRNNDKYRSLLSNTVIFQPSNAIVKPNKVGTIDKFKRTKINNKTNMAFCCCNLIEVLTPLL